MEAPKSLPEVPKSVPEGSQAAPGELPEGSGDFRRPPERSKGLPEDNFGHFWMHFGAILESFVGNVWIKNTSKVHAFF